MAYYEVILSSNACINQFRLANSTEIHGLMSSKESLKLSINENPLNYKNTLMDFCLAIS